MAEFAETVVLVAAMEQDVGEVDRLLVDFLSNELADLSASLELLDERIRAERRRRTRAR